MRQKEEEKEEEEKEEEEEANDHKRHQGGGGRGVVQLYWKAVLFLNDSQYVPGDRGGRQRHRARCICRTFSLLFGML
jgi:hypothetical protein